MKPTPKTGSAAVAKERLLCILNSDRWNTGPINRYCSRYIAERLRNKPKP